MYIVRWLMGHPIVAIWVLLGTAILLALGSGIKDDVIAGSDLTSKASKVVTNIESSAEIEVKTTVITDERKILETKPAFAPLKSELDNVKVKKSNNLLAPSDVKGAATADINQITGEEMLLMAREAYWNNGLDEAAQIYTKLIEKEPKVLEHKGELGNVYWRQGYPKKAAELYSDIALPMINNGKTERVANMIGFIGLFYPDRAAEIHKKMQSKK